MSTNENAPSRAEADFDAAVDKAYDARWWDTHDNVSITAYWMADEGGFEANEIAHLVEKPWKYTREWLMAEAAIGQNGGSGAWLEGPDEDDPDTRPPNWDFAQGVAEAHALNQTIVPFPTWEVTLVRPPQDRAREQYRQAYDPAHGGTPLTDDELGVLRAANQQAEFDSYVPEGEEGWVHADEDMQRGDR